MVSPGSSALGIIGIICQHWPSKTSETGMTLEITWPNTLIWQKTRAQRDSGTFAEEPVSSKAENWNSSLLTCISALFI